MQPAESFASVKPSYKMFTMTVHILAFRIACVAPGDISSIVLSSGSDVVDWLFHHVEGFSDRREARKYASNLLKAGYIRHTVNKITFSEQCYYIFGDLCGSK